MGSSLIHNYLLTVLSLLLFAIPYIHIRQCMPNKWYAAPLMAVAGYLFGFMSNLAPIAFLITYTVCKLYAFIRKKGYHIAPWEVCGIVGVLLGVATQYLLGPGLSSYTNGHYAIDFDYVPFSQIISDPIGSIGKLMIHAVANYSRVLMPPIICLLACLIVYAIVKKLKNEPLQLKEALTPKRRVAMVCLLFVFFYIVGLIIKNKNYGLLIHGKIAP